MGLDMSNRLCDCGSGKSSIIQYDADGIYLCRTCEDCYQTKMGRFRPDIQSVSSTAYGEVVDEEPDINDSVEQFPLYRWEE
jgi:hypothetical protein